MNFTMYLAEGILVVTPRGTLDSRTTGPLCDALVAQVRGGRRRMAIDLSELDVITRAGIRGIIVTAKLMQAARGDLRLCGAAPETRAFLSRASFDHLMAFEPSVQAAVRALSDGLGGHTMRSSLAEALTRPAAQPASCELPEILRTEHDRFVQKRRKPARRRAIHVA